MLDEITELLMDLTELKDEKENIDLQIETLEKHIQHLLNQN